jgi:hypothetical protein
MPSTLKEIPRKSRQCYLGNETHSSGTIHTEHLRRSREHKAYAQSPRSAAHGFLSEEKEWSVVLIGSPSVSPIKLSSALANHKISPIVPRPFFGVGNVLLGTQIGPSGAIARSWSHYERVAQEDLMAKQAFAIRPFLVGSI